MENQTPSGSNFPDLSQLRQQVNQFWTETYTAYSTQERLDYWTHQLQTGLHWERSQGNDPYTLFHPAAFTAWVEQEPQFAQWLPELAARLELDLAEIQRRIDLH